VAFFPWKPEYSVGIEKFDRQHKVLVHYLNELYEALQAGRGQRALAHVLNGLMVYTRTHFADEEALMKRCGYPGYAEHKRKHDKMTAHVRMLKKKFDSGEISSPVQITNFLNSWLARHIMGTDKAYGPFLIKKGVPPH
jgi:hemerythrin-like metal-binding protein